MRTIGLLLVSVVLTVTLCAQNTARPKPEVIYEVEQLDAQPMYPGGPSAFFTFLEKHIQMHKDSLAKYDGKLELSFIVYSDGKVNAVRLDDGTHRFKNIEASIFNNMPKWKPAMKNGKAVSCRYVVKPHFKK